MNIVFEWDEHKARDNYIKHHIDFEEAKTVFNDPYSITVHDPLHSEDETRYIDIGCSSTGRILVVVYTERGNVIRIISSRTAAKKERQEYEENPV